VTPEREQHLLRVIEIWKARAKTARQQAFKEAAEVADKVRKAAARPGGSDSLSMERSSGRQAAAIEIRTELRALAEKKEGES
jgi:hypothetical protein